MNVLVTGGAGYIGSHTCVELYKMVHTILSCAFRAGRQWRREMYGLRFLAAMPLTAEPRSHKTVLNRFMKN